MVDQSGDITGDTTWLASDITRIVGNVRVTAGATLTIEPGAVVKFNSGGDLKILVEGTLIADGTAELPIVFTSTADDTGLDGLLGTADDNDTNGNGPSNGSPSQWEAIQFSARTGDPSILDHVSVRFGGENVAASVITAGPLTVTDSTIASSATAGMRINASNPTVTGTEFVSNAQAAISMSPDSDPDIRVITLTNNQINGVNLDGGTLTADIKWDDPDIVYRLTGDVTVPSGKTLTIAAGQIVKTTNDVSLIVGGTLDVNGTAALPIIFTSDSDDAAGGDTNNNGASSGSPGDPGGIRFSPGSTGSVLDSLEVRFAGDPFIRPALVIDNADVTIHGGAIRSSASAGLRIINSDPVISGMTFADNAGAAISMDPSSNPAITSPTLSGNVINALAVDSGTLTKDGVWDDPDIVYRLSGQFGNVVVPAGVTLTIGPGQIIKAAPNVSTELFVDGTLIANGTVDAPIIFTSDRDDSAGGDTNNNGPSSGAFFDWQALRFRATSTGSVLNHIEMRFAGANVPAAVTVIDAPLTMTSSIIRGSASSAVAAQTNAAVTLENNLLINSTVSGIAVASGATVTATNNTIDGGLRGVHVQISANADLRNNLITNNSSAGILVENLATATAVFNDVFNPSGTNYSGLTDQTGLNGNISANPRYFNRAGQMYTLLTGSPAADAATSDFAPPTDARGQARFDDTNIPNTGGGATPFFDMGALERAEISTSDVDLATLDVSGPTTGLPGDTVTINWTVKNQGAGVAPGGWSDAIYVSKDPELSLDDVLLGRLDHADDLGAGQSYSASKDVTLSGVTAGSLYFIVRSNDFQQVFEGIATQNNAAASAQTIDLPISQLTPGVALADQFTAAGQSHFYQVTVAAGQTLNVALDSAAVSGATELYISRGELPSRSAFDFHASAVQPDQSITVAGTGPGTYFILAFSNSGVAAASAFTVKASVAGFDVAGVSPSSGANVGQVTLAVHGTALTPGTVVSLIAPDSGVIAAVATQFADASTTFATFDLTGLATGAYSVRIADGVATDTAAGIFNVVAGSAGHLTTRIIAPDRIRAGVVGSLTVEYTNDGGADLVAPLLLLQSDHAKIRFTDQTAFDGTQLAFMGINSSGPAGVLPPGATGSIKVLFLPVTGDPLNFNVGQITADMAIDWAGAEEDLRPAEIPADAWGAIFANFHASVGDTGAEFEAALARDATYLSKLGTYTADVARLQQFELQLAGNFGTISQRYALGALGRGLPDPTDISATLETDGSVTIRSAGKQRLFFPQTGGFHGVAGDTGQLTLVDGAFRVREADGSLTAFTPGGKLDFIEDSSGNRVTAAYTSGRLTSLTDSFGDQVSLAYNGAGRISQITDPVGNITTFTYDNSGEHLLSATDSSGTMSFTYITGQGAAREHALASITFPDGKHEFFQYDTQGRITHQELDGGDQPVDFSYATFGGVTVTDAGGAVTTGLFNESGQMALLTDALGRVTRSKFDSLGRLKRVVDPAGQNTDFKFDAAGNVIGVLDPAGNETAATFSTALGRVLSVRDALGHTLSFGLDAAGNATSLTYPDGSVEKSSYNTAGIPTQIADRDGHVTALTYDSHNLITREQFADGTVTDYTYDAHRNLLTATDASGTTQFTYDAADRVTHASYPGGRSLDFTYDSAGRRTQMTDQAGFSFHYAYDTDGRLSAVTRGAGVSVASYTYDATGRVSRQDLGNGTFTTYTYDDAGQVTSIVHHASGGAVQSRFDYTYDALGRIDTLTTLDGTTTYGYDAANELTSVALPGGRVITYEYDAAGNRIRVTDTGGSTENYATNVLNEYTSAGNATFTYDSAGNLLTRTDGGGTTTYGYDARGRLGSVDSPSEQISYEYDALGNRSAVTTNGVRAEYMIDPTGMGDIVAEFDGSGQLVARYAQGGGGLVGSIDAEGADSYYAFDSVGNTAQITGSNGSVVNTYRYLPFGEIASQTGSAHNPFTFGGQVGVTEDAPNLYSMRARFYDSSLGRFLSADPSGIASSDLNFYRYTGNAPTMFADPSGLAPQVVAGVFGAAASAGSETIVAPLANVGLETIVTPVVQGNLATRVISSLSAAGQRGILNLGTGLNGLVNIAMLAGADQILPEFALVNATVTSIGVGLITLSAGATAVGVGFLAGAAGLVGAGAAGVALGIGSVVGGTAFLAGVGLRQLQPIKSFRNALGDAIVTKFFSPETVTFGGRGRLLLEASTKLCGDLDLSSQQEVCFKRLQQFGITQVRPTDPNDIGGLAGFGPEHFITGSETLPYTILFENKPDAGAPAVQVVITHQLDADEDLGTFELGDIGFADQRVEVPAGLHFFSTRVDNTAVSGEFVDITAELDLATRTVTWTFTSIDPVTGQIATAIDAGFLPPDITSPEGEGFVNYTIHANPSLTTGTTIDAQASIVFDTNAPLDTPVFTNTIDTSAPTSSVEALAAAQFDANFTVTWAGDDDALGSGIAFFDVFVSDNGAPATLFKSHTTDTSGLFNGQSGHTYDFFSVATDNVGNVEPTPSSAQATTTVSPSVDVDFGTGAAKSIQYTDGDGTVVTIKVTIGSATAQFQGANITVDNTSKGAFVTGDNLAVRQIALTGTTAKSVLSITAKGGDGVATVGAIVADAALGSINAPAIDLIGAGITMDAAATLATLKLHDTLNGADILAPATTLTTGVAITARRFGAGTDVTLGSGIKSLTLADYAAGTVTAPWASAITTKAVAVAAIAGDFKAELHLSGVGAPKGIALGTVKIAGSLGSGDALDPAQWDITGDAKAITGGNVTGWSLAMHSSLASLTLKRVASADLDIDGGLGKVSAIEWLAGSIQAQAITSITTKGDTKSLVPGDFAADITGTRLAAMSVKGDLTGSQIALSQAVDLKLAALGKLTVTGQMLGTSLRTVGNIGTVALGAMRQSTLTAGVDPNILGLPDPAADFDVIASIKSLTIKSIKNDANPAFAGSIVAASTLGAINLLTINPGNAAAPFGLAGHIFKQIAFTASGVKHTIKTAADLPGLGLPLTDFDIRIL